MRRLAGSLIALIVLAYAGSALWLMSQETELVFRAGRPLGPARPSFAYEQIDLPRDDGARQFAWVMPAAANASDRAWMLYLHGNAATIASRVNVARYTSLRALGLNILAPEYRGFGGLDGIPSESGVIADARAAYEHLRSRLGVPAERIIIFGWSLGAAIAVDLASHVPQAAVILEGAPASVVAIGQRQYPYFPIRLLIRNPFEAILKIGDVKSPLLFIHSPEDAIIPISEGRRLYEAAVAPKIFVEVRGGHIDASEVDAPVFYGAIRTFLAARNLLPAPALDHLSTAR